MAARTIQARNNARHHRRGRRRCRVGSKIDVSLFSSAIHREITFQVKLVVSMVTELALGLLSLPPLPLSLSFFLSFVFCPPFSVSPLLFLEIALSLFLSFFLLGQGRPTVCSFFGLVGRSVAFVKETFSRNECIFIATFVLRYTAQDAFSRRSAIVLREAWVVAVARTRRSRFSAFYFAGALIAL